MEEGFAEKILGIRKKFSKVYRFLAPLKKIFSLRLFLVFLAISTLVSIYFLHAYHEYILHPETLEEISYDEVSPYFMSFFWMLGTFTAGYAEAPYTTVGRILDLVIMAIGMATYATIVSSIASYLVSANVGSMFGMARAKKKIDCIICGWNPVSQSAFAELNKEGAEMVVIDKEAMPEAKMKNVHFILGDPTKKEILKLANIKNAKSVVLAMEEDSDVLLALHVIRELNPWIHIVAKINHYGHVKMAEATGADMVVSPPSIGGRLLSIATDSPAVVDWLVKSTTGEKGFKLLEYDVTNESPVVNKTIAQIRQDLKSQAKIIGVDTVEGFDKVPDDDLKIEAGNKLIMVIHEGRFKMLK